MNIYLNGIILCKKVKEDVRTSHIPVIMLTAKDSLQNREEGYMAGADSYLTKPFSASLLRRGIHNLLESRRKLANQFSSIEDNLESEKVDVTYLADKLFINKSTIYMNMKALTYIFTNVYVRKIKMRNAEKLILEGRYTISEVAFRVGMNSPIYFRQCFKEEFGISPSEHLKGLKRE